MAEKETLKQKVEELTPKKIFEEYEEAKNYKSNIGNNGIYEQAKKNERFMLGDQWRDADIGDIPKVVMNVIKQIGDFKVSNIISNPCTAVYEFDGVPTHLEAQRSPDTNEIMNVMTDIGQIESKISFEEEHNAVATAITSHFSSVWERCKMDKLNQTGVRKAYMHGAYVLYSRFNPHLSTGLYADEGRKTAIKGDIEVEILNITNVYFGNPAECDVQKQPWITISQRKALDVIKREMGKNNRPQADIESVKADDDNNEAGNYNNESGNKKEYVTLLTRFWRENDTIMAIQCVENVIVKEAWDTGITLYPICIFCWDETDNCIYGHSEITELIPNQVAINRMISLEILSEMMMGMPKIIYDATAISQEITNDPGQIIAVENPGDVRNAFYYVNPAQISPNWNRVQQSLIDNTKSISGATSVALGDVRPENTSAIVALREAANQPLQPILNRYYAFVEDIARIWGEMILKKYGKRSLRVVSQGEVTYVPFDADKYKNMMLTARIEVGPSTLWATSTVISTLDNLLERNAIDVIQYLERLPEGTIPKKQELINDIRGQRQAQAQAQPNPSAAPQGVDPTALLDTLSPEQLAVAQEHPEMLQNAMSGAQM
ncbi:MAG: hypothetical protein IIW48_07405 [Clostridia bacterium]|nr:hypothetical protein [Clostridia bacterium]